MSNLEYLTENFAVFTKTTDVVIPTGVLDHCYILSNCVYLSTDQNLVIQGRLKRCNV